MLCACYMPIALHWLRKTKDQQQKELVEYYENVYRFASYNVLSLDAACNIRSMHSYNTDRINWTNGIYNMHGDRLA